MGQQDQQQQTRDGQDATRLASSTAMKYVTAIALVMGAVCANLALHNFIAPLASPLLFAAVLLASWQGGWGPGLVATILAALADDYFFIPPVGALDFNAANLERLGVFLAVSLLTSSLTSQRLRALRERDRLLVLERDARRAAEEANRTKDRFLAVTTHELRTPLSAITMWAELLAAEPLPEEAKQGIDAIRRSAESQRRLIDDLMDVARLSTGKLRLELRPVELSGAARAAVESMRPLASAKGIELSASTDAVTAVAQADATRLQQILTNLLTNAIKFTPPGGRVDLNLSRRAGNVAALAVRDTGRGIHADQLSRVFDRFWQAGSTPSTAGDGLGLGLAIVRDLVRLHGGSVCATSEGEARGSTFTVELPIVESNETRVEPAVVREPTFARERHLARREHTPGER